jgi:hypothetical protein
VIAKSDWPDDYPDLLSSLIALLSSHSSDSVHGAIQVLTEFIKSDLTEDQILPVLRDLLPVLLSILGSPQVCAKLTSHSALPLYQSVLRCPHPCSYCVCFPTMCHRALYGQRPTSSGRERNNCTTTPCLVGGIQSPLEVGSCTRCRE